MRKEFKVQVNDGIDNITLWIPFVESKFLGISLTEESPGEMRRISMELLDVEQIVKLRDFLNEVLDSEEMVKQYREKQIAETLARMVSPKK